MWLILLLAAVVYGTYQHRATATRPGAAKEIGGMAAFWSPLDDGSGSAETVEPAVLTSTGSQLGGLGDQRPLAVAVGPAGVVAVGLDVAEGTDAAVWASIDGADWARIPDPATTLGGPGNQEARGVAAWPVGSPVVGFVAVGTDTLVTGVSAPADGTESAEIDAAIWVSDTGVAWRRVPHDVDDLGGPGAQVMEAVTVAGPGMVAVGWTRHRSVPGGGGRLGVE